MHDDARWETLDRLFLAARALPPAQRAAFIEAEAAGDPELQAELRALLAADTGEVGRRVERAVESLTPALTPGGPAGLREGSVVGHYRVLRELGRGGMGSVYLAERADDAFRQTVALKVVQPAFLTDETRRRFHAERQILADLAHPGIARLLDGGSTDDGVPFVVMEYVDGSTIERFCEEHALSVKARLRLFLQVCAGVQFAHQNLVVHRDLKPGNVLVTADGAVKLLDFGIARLLDPLEGTTQETVDARGALRFLTPEYASPEQIRGAPVTTATDVYSLGVLLYQLLTGQLPYRFERRVPQEFERVICTVDPERPSTAARRSAERRSAARSLPNAGAEVGEAWGAERGRGLEGDLDHIALKALRKEPGHRYASVAQLADDIERHLNDEPVLARPPSVAYRTGRFVKRYRGRVAVAAMVFLAALTMTAFYTVRLAEERDAARASALQAEQVVEFLTSVFETSDPSESRGATVTARELLDRGAERIRGSLADEPLVRSRLLGTLGTVYSKMGLETEAVPFFEDALSEVERATAPGSPERAQRQNALASALVDIEEWDRAEALSRDVIDSRDEARFTEREAGALQTISEVFWGRRQFDSARHYMSEFEAMLRADDAVDGVTLGTALTLRGLLETDAGDDAAADPYLTEALSAFRDTLDAEHPDVLVATSNLGYLRHRQGRYPAADSLYSAAIAIQRRILGPDHVDLGTTLNNRASVLKELDRPAEAEPLQREALAIYRATFGPDHSVVARALNNLANLLYEQGDAVGALELHEQALAIRLPVYGPSHDQVAASYGNMAAAYRDLGELDVAETLYRRTLEIDRAAVGDDHPFVLADLSNIADVRTDRGGAADAVAMIQPALETAARVLGSEHPHFARILVVQGRALLDVGRAADAEAVLRRALAINQATLPASHWRIADTRSLLGASLLAQGRTGEAMPLLEEGHRAILARMGAGHRITRAAAARLAQR
ncbi:MAG: serine/threonine-protein kinase [Gemmatimonadota bacterium]